jgi:hypothetical protein
MLKLRRFLCGCFGFLALSFLAAGVGTVPGIFRHAHAPDQLSVHRFSPFVSELLAMLAKLVLLIPIPLAILYGMAWWAIGKSKSSARIWALAASASLVLQGGVFLAMVSFVMSRYRVHGSPNGLIGFCVLNLAAGIAGIVAFGRRDATAAPIAKPKPQRIAGDGTSLIVDKLAVLFSLAGYFGGQYLWVRWGMRAQLPIIHGYSVWILLVAAVLIETVFHELGHVGVGWYLGMKLRAFIVGPFHWQIRDGKWQFKIVPSKLFGGGGAAALVPVDPNQSKWHEIAMIAAGPLASLLTGLYAMALTLLAKGAFYERAWQLLALIATFGLISFVVNLLPVRPDALYSDGARIHQLLKGGPWADLQRVFSVVGSTTVTPLRPRDYDMAAIYRAAESFTTGRYGLLLRLFAVSHYLDKDKLREAGEWLASAELVYNQSASDIPAELHTAFVFDTAFLRRDAHAARQWWDRMEAKKPTHFGVDYWLAKSALSWIENHPQEARDAWASGNALAEKLPEFGTYQFDRFRYAELKRLLDAPLSAAAEELQQVAVSV